MPSLRRALFMLSSVRCRDHRRTLRQCRHLARAHSRKC
jgi:hypothetical protein